MPSNVIAFNETKYLAKRVVVSVIIPALNEQDSISTVVEGLQRQLTQSGFDDHFEIIVADNNSIDCTAQFAKQAGAKVIHESSPGYGAACWSACSIAQGDILLFVDADGVTEPADSIRLISEIERGADLVIGVRNNPETGSMSASQIFGNWLACNLLRMFWRIRTADLGPHRAVRRAAFDEMKMEDRGFGWTVEMQIKAALKNFVVREIDVSWYARTQGQSKIGGTLSGIFKAGFGILGMIARMQRKYPGNKTARQPDGKTVGRSTDSSTRETAPRHFPVTRKSLSLLQNTLQHPIEERKTL